MVAGSLGHHPGKGRWLGTPSSSKSMKKVLDLHQGIMEAALQPPDPGPNIDGLDTALARDSDDDME